MRLVPGYLEAREVEAQMRGAVGWGGLFAAARRINRLPVDESRRQTLWSVYAEAVQAMWQMRWRPNPLGGPGEMVRTRKMPQPRKHKRAAA